MFDVRDDMKECVCAEQNDVNNIIDKIGLKYVFLKVHILSNMFVKKYIFYKIRFLKRAHIL